MLKEHHTLKRLITKKYVLSKAGCLSCTLRFGLHEIPIMNRTLPCGLGNNIACTRIFDNFPGMLTYVLFLENCQKSVCMHGCSPIHEEKFLRVSNLGDKSVPIKRTLGYGSVGSVI